MSFEFVFLENSCHFYVKMIRKLIQKSTKNEAFGVSKFTQIQHAMVSPFKAQIWWPLGASWGPLGPSWGRLGPSLGPSWGRLGASWGCIGASWARLAGILGRLRRVLERPGRVLGASWRVLRACSLFESIFQRVFIDFSLENVAQKS